MLASFILLFLLPGSWQWSQLRRPKSFVGLPTVKEILSAAGYQSTDIEVITEDGYSLWMHRLSNNTGPPIMIHHGLFVTSECWISRGPKKDLVFYLLKEGYDVYLTNQRGTVYNDYSLKYNRSDPRFWNFSFHEAGQYDLPAFINQVLKIRGTRKLFVIAHSLGTATFLVTASMRPEYNSKIAATVLLSPLAFTPSAKDLKPFMKFILPKADATYYWEQKLGMYEVLPRTPAFIKFLKSVCRYKSKMQSWCLDFIGWYLGEHRSNLDKKDFGFHMPYFSGGTSAKTVYHVMQLFKSGEFKLFDYGKKDNLAVYGNEKPPFYNIGLISAPVAIFWSYNDPLLSEESVNKLVSLLPRLLFSKPVPDRQFSHLDMYLGINANKVLYPDIIKLLNSLTLH